MIFCCDEWLTFGSLLWAAQTAGLSDPGEGLGLSFSCSSQFVLISYELRHTVPESQNQVDLE